MKKNRSLLKIGEVAKKVGVTVRTIRYYEELGLLYPTEKSSGGFRLYTEADVTRLLFIKQFKELNFSIEEIKDLLNSTDLGEGKKRRISASQSLLYKQLEEVETKIKEMEETKAEIQKAINSLEACKLCTADPCPPDCKNKKRML